MSYFYPFSSFFIIKPFCLFSGQSISTQFKPFPQNSVLYSVFFPIFAQFWLVWASFIASIYSFQIQGKFPFSLNQCKRQTDSPLDEIVSRNNKNSIKFFKIHSAIGRMKCISAIFKLRIISCCFFLFMQVKKWSTNWNVVHITLFIQHLACCLRHF